MQINFLFQPVNKTRNCVDMAFELHVLIGAKAQPQSKFHFQFMNTFVSGKKQLLTKSIITVRMKHWFISKAFYKSFSILGCSNLSS